MKTSVDLLNKAALGLGGPGRVAVHLALEEGPTRPRPRQSTIQWARKFPSVIQLAPFVAPPNDSYCAGTPAPATETLLIMSAAPMY